ncbi:MAG TPA: HD domain-containing phosphohydrolase [Gemmatimonadaceae bacterium]|nr:HD domain-containing phosphohydrolase [Gemmatimonadaceae bacterium]
MRLDEPCLVYHGARIDPSSFGERDGRWRTASHLRELGHSGDGPAVLIVDESIAAEIASLPRPPQNVILVAGDEPSERALTHRSHLSVVGLEASAERKEILRAACLLACARAVSLRRRRQLGRANRELRELNRIGMQLTFERDLDDLLHQILSLGKKLTASDGAAVFLANPASKPLRLDLLLFQLDSVPDAQPDTFTIVIDDTSIAGHSARVRAPIVVRDAYDLPPNATFIMDPAFDERFGYHRRSMLFVPMVDHLDRLVGLLAFVNRKSDPAARITSKEAADQFVLPYTRREVRLARSLASQAAVSIENAQLYAQIEHTLEAVVEAAVSAVDARDPATAGHSLRAAELSVKLARAVNRATTGPYRDVHFTKKQIRELRLAALLHDLGKLVVPEDLLTKSTKLPPVLRERVNARFGLIRQTMALESCRRGGSAADLARELEELDYMKAVVRDADEPSLMPENPAVELGDIGRRTFVGADGKEHHYLTKEELHYLQLPYGTLDERERAAVEEHVSATHRFLDHIPWTDDLRNIAAYAYGHHEKLDGTGYPRRLTADHIPLQTRIITIADIYDALTEADRPYKPAVSRQRALEILQAEADAGRIDAELLRILIASKAYE